jgi:hypothetical protein
MLASCGAPSPSISDITAADRTPAAQTEQVRHWGLRTRGVAKRRWKEPKRLEVEEKPPKISYFSYFETFRNHLFPQILDVRFSPNISIRESVTTSGNPNRSAVARHGSAIARHGSTIAVQHASTDLAEAPQMARGCRRS